jgi:hypothetical protein
MTGVSEQPGRYQRTAPGMVGAMIVLVLLVVGFAVVGDLVRQEPPSPVSTVDYRPALDQARQQADYRVLAPERLPAGWRATQVQFSPGPEQHWHLAFLTDEGRYVGLEQARTGPQPLLHEYVDAEPVEGQPVTVDGARWATWHDDGGDLALVRTEAGVSTVLVGHDVPTSELIDFLGRLR